MNRIVITLTEHGEFDYVSCDEDCRVFIHDITCKSEPIYELSHAKRVGIQYVTQEIGNNKAATYDGGVGGWKNTNPEIKVIK